MLYTIEGLDASGKSTLVENLEKWAEEHNYAPRKIQAEPISKNTDIILTQEPTQKETGIKVREALGAKENEFHPMSVLFRFLSDHAFHVNTQIPREFLQNRLVVSDRYTGSRAAYQSQSVSEYFTTDPLPLIQQLHHNSLSVKPNSEYIDLGKTALSYTTQRKYHPLTYYFFGLSMKPTQDIEYPINDFTELPDLIVEEDEYPPNWSHIPTKQFYLDTSLDVIESRLSKNTETEIFEKREFLENVRESYDSLIEQHNSTYIRINPTNYQNSYEIVEEVIVPELFEN